ncbi:hypothetical protein [Terriglobus tenax]|uniref:hypothetical protein n=1 Tax=Terriglobus tenax TaxID=1111115 RepID=UPI0021E0A2E2|nr:hypothetical protein [Terriglobus tenax]
MRRLFAITLLCALPAVAADKKPPAADPATSYPAKDAHEAEKVVVAADVCDTDEKCPFFRIKYVANDLLPIRVIVTNNSDSTLSLDEARMQMMTENNDKIPAAIEEEVNRRMFTYKNAKGTKVPLPAPLPPITVHHPVDKKITQDFNEFGFQTTTVAPHKTVAGYLIYDIRDVKNPIDGSDLYIRKVMARAPQETENHELFAFQIPLKLSYRTSHAQKP